MREWGLDGIICTDGGGLRQLVSDHKAFPDLADRCRRLYQGRHQSLPRPTQGGGDRGARQGAAHRNRHRRCLARPVPRIAPTRPARSSRSSPIRRYRLHGRSEPWNAPETRALVREVTRQVPSSCSRTPPTCCRSTLEDRKSIAVVGPLANTVLLDLVLRYARLMRSHPRDGIERRGKPLALRPVSHQRQLGSAT